MVETDVDLTPTVLTKRGNMTTQTLERLYIPPFGADTSGYETEGDALVQVLADGTNINQIWQELRTVLATWNSERSAVASLLAYDTTDTAQAVPQSISDESFEEASEFGEPTGIRIPKEYLLLGYDLKDYDRASRFTWKALRAMTAEQVRASMDGILAADNKLINGLILQRLFDNTPTQNEWGHTVYPLWSNDGVVPPAWAGKAFDASHNHYLASGSATLDRADLETSFTHISEHGYSTEAPSQLLVLCNPDLGKVISTFNAGVENNNDKVAAYDFIPSAGMPPYLLKQGDSIQGTPAPSSYNGLKVQGSYGPALVIESWYVPANYFATVAAAGPNSPLNPVGVRHHQNAAYQGLRMIPGRDQRYPLTESFAARAVGTGVRHRGAACVTQVTTGSYTVPLIPK